MKKRLFVALVTGLIAASMFGGIASAKVHVITPLLQITVDNANSGGNGVNGTPADSALGGPIAGPIPINTGNGAIELFEGGWGATDGHTPNENPLP